MTAGKYIINYYASVFHKLKVGASAICVSLLLFVSATDAQTIYRAEYFFDTDPGVGNGTTIPITPGTTISFNATIPTTSLANGFHFLGIRVKETGGLWSSLELRGFYISTSTSDVANLSAAEYFFDTDPGNGNGNPISITPGATTNFTISIPTTSLGAGFHFLTIRTKGSDGKWGLFESRGFFITTSTSNVPDLTAAEYFFDTDPGLGNGTPVSITPGATSSFVISVPTTSLTAGFHFLGVRTKGANGKWGNFEARGFYISTSTTDVPNLATAEYFFDTDPGLGNGTPVSITPGAISNFAINIPTTSLTPGFHFLAVRTKGLNGAWGNFESRGFYISPVQSTTPDIVAAEFFYDGVDPGEGNGTALSVTPGPTIDENLVIVLNGVPSGNRKLSIRVLDASGIWSAIETRPFNVLACTPPTSPTATGGSRCNSGTVILNATAGATGTQVYRWYADDVTSTVLFTGAAFTTPTLNTSTDYYVSVYDPTTLCESNRTKVTATIITSDPPPLNITNATICEGNSIKIFAPTGFTTYLWSNGETTREIIVTTAGDYTVVVGNGTCESLPSVPASIIVSAKPATPTISASGTTNLCDGASVTISAPAGFTYLWSSGATTETIAVTTAGKYSVLVSDGGGCSSSPSNEIEVKAFTTPVKPAVQVFGELALCGTNSVGLLGPSGFSVYQWSDGQTTQGITVSAAGTFSLIVGNDANCLSPVSDIVTVTATGQPCNSGGGSNAPPVIDTVPLATQIEGSLNFDLTTVVSDADGNIDYASLNVIDNKTTKGAPAIIDAAAMLLINYEGLPFTGKDRFTLEACDLAGACAQQVFDVDVVGGVQVYNGVSPDGDGLNDFLYIKYLDVVEGASTNKVTILNRWGDIVFEIENYDNISRVFTGQTNSGKELPSGTYFYKIDFAQGSPMNGFISLKR
ncbi:MAG: gliding motility-associated C-terminal domain-containing protein [Cytophagales bacterium]|nr:gliding motility-associated C-terminal domain-containing protein [Cytophagales bacterium]